MTSSSNARYVHSSHRASPPIRSMLRKIELGGPTLCCFQPEPTKVLWLSLKTEKCSGINCLCEDGLLSAITSTDNKHKHTGRRQRCDDRSNAPREPQLVVPQLSIHCCPSPTLSSPPCYGCTRHTMGCCDSCPSEVSRAVAISSSPTRSTEGPSPCSALAQKGRPLGRLPLPLSRHPLAQRVVPGRGCTRPSSRAHHGHRR